MLVVALLVICSGAQGKGFFFLADVVRGLLAAVTGGCLVMRVHGNVKRGAGCFHLWMHFRRDVPLLSAHFPASEKLSLRTV